eukprot:CAMPEP_0170513424 /NCGR_PEP_ID=MMETSP0208-20121228/67393_1 /TAXON_ID=197538 /ORGANISM="Strombidium inclinatum, Strain S3" /LENGTH=84 /DNA_ID=CAMNT_0010797153 /DNA_START=1548 /DNA_END=1798 /DNA_ORIENTATION=+
MELQIQKSIKEKRELEEKEKAGIKDDDEFALTSGALEEHYKEIIEQLRRKIYIQTNEDSSDIEMETDPQYLKDLADFKKYRQYL